MRTTALPSYVDQMRARVDQQLDSYSQWGDECPRLLGDAIRHSLLAPGKRLRPLLVLMAADACGSPWERALAAACAVEMVHTYSLIHDDLPAMDDDDMRRGRPSCHAQFGEATAILAGDALLALAFEVLARDTEPSTIAARCCAELARAAGATQLVGGQSDDLTAEFGSGGLDELLAIHDRKTGAMLQVSLTLGAIIARAADEPLDALQSYGRKLGLAFQIVDDLLDVCGDADRLGKRAGKDSEHGKLTFPAVLGIDESRRRARELIDQACEALRVLGPRASGLETLARYVLERSH